MDPGSGNTDTATGGGSATGTGTTAADTTAGDSSSGSTSDDTTGGNWDQDHPSCMGMAPDECGGDHCCATDAVPGGWFAMGRGETNSCPGAPAAGDACGQTTATCQAGTVTWGCPQGTWIDLGGLDAGMGGGDDELPEHAAYVGSYGLDRYEVTVGRMRRFIEAYDKAGLLAVLDGGAGAHPVIAGTQWQASWDIRLPDTPGELETALDCDPTATWTAMPASNETYPLTCASWYLAYAFCAWDEGRLPTEAEWERAAIGGDDNRLYPWGDDAPSAMLANYDATDGTTMVDVFAKPAGAGRHGQQGLAGSAWEWVLDLSDPGWYAGAGNDCQDCANVSGDAARLMRGGNWEYGASSLRGAERFPGTAAAYWRGSGLRCARD
ncbi:formylglycine-generating enzyme family protein [Paraliomyxa miuraensis]|nr:formylglycine-generating enzyme family protein [Paraliomyxa miuraensis]